MNHALKKILITIDFRNRFEALFARHDHADFFESFDPIHVKPIIEKYGYTCSYNKSHKFFKVLEKEKNRYDTSLHISLRYGIVEFILNAEIDNEGCGGPFAYMSECLGSKEKIKDPRFSDYSELEDILKDGVRIYEDIKNELLAQ